MSNRKSSLIDLNHLEMTMFQTITALTEAMVRQAAVEHRGPVISPNPEDRENYIQDLRDDLSIQRQRLDEYLVSIDWKYSPLPGNPKHWPTWWDALRLYTNYTQFSLEGFPDKPLASR